MTATTDRPVSAAEFAAAMTAFAPFEARPALAVAVSGGRDSMALVLLAADWSAERGGWLVALTVDHGLRSAAAAEALQVGRWLAARGIEHRVLMWHGPHPTSGVQAAAREARYRLLEDCCTELGIVHLLLGHQRDDQAETIHMRRARQSAGPGLAGMAALRETARLRVLRPLLTVPRARLAATLRRRGQAWLDDPSNGDPAFERSRVRAVLRDTGVARDTSAVIAARRGADSAVSQALARCVTLLPEGFARVDVAAFAAFAQPVRRAALARCVTTVGGRSYPPRGDRLDRVVAALDGGRLGRGRTLGGCRILPAPGTRGAAWLIVREAPRGGLSTDIVAGGRVRWDGRYAIAAGRDVAAGLRIAALGSTDWRRIAGALAAVRRIRLPAPTAHGLPAIRSGDALYAVPTAGIGQTGDIDVRFVPDRPLSDAGFVAGSPDMQL